MTGNVPPPNKSRVYWTWRGTRGFTRDRRRYGFISPRRPFSQDGYNGQPDWLRRARSAAISQSDLAYCRPGRSPAGSWANTRDTTGTRRRWWVVATAALCGSGAAWKKGHTHARAPTKHSAPYDYTHTYWYIYTYIYIHAYTQTHARLGFFFFSFSIPSLVYSFNLCLSHRRCGALVGCFSLSHTFTPSVARARVHARSFSSYSLRCLIPCCAAHTSRVQTYRLPIWTWPPNDCEKQYHGMVVLNSTVTDHHRRRRHHHHRHRRLRRRCDHG